MCGDGKGTKYIVIFYICFYIVMSVKILVAFLLLAVLGAGLRVREE